ncbi:MAG: glycosyltransferase [Cyclobacteriaceae bacterium]
MGWQSDVKSFYQIADLYIHTANFEGMPFSLLEAMSFKLPCVVSEDLYKDLSFPEGIICKGIDGLKTLVDDRDAAQNIGVKGFEYVQANFSLDTIANSYLRIYEKVSHV